MTTVSHSLPSTVKFAAVTPPTFHVLDPSKQDFYLLKELLARLNVLEDLSGMERTR